MRIAEDKFINDTNTKRVNVYEWMLDSKLHIKEFKAASIGWLDDETGLYGQSALFNYGLFVDEYENAKGI